MSERTAYNAGYNAARWDGLKYSDGRLEDDFGSREYFWKGWEDGFMENPNKAACLIVAGSGVVNSLNYYCRQALRCVDRDRSTREGSHWVVPTTQLLDEATNFIF